MKINDKKLLNGIKLSLFGIGIIMIVYQGIYDTISKGLLGNASTDLYINAFLYIIIGICGLIIFAILKNAFYDIYEYEYESK